MPRSRRIGLLERLVKSGQFVLQFNRTYRVLTTIRKNSLTTNVLSPYKWNHLAGEVCILYMKIFDSDFR
jgi:hypothetical protein